ncbi:MAG: chemotaxis protein CheB, partial [Pseudomonadota bacterium]
MTALQKKNKKTTSKPKKEADQPGQDAANNEIHWVGVGASAGGLEAIRELIKHFPENANNITCIIAQHLSPKYQSMMVQILERETTIPVVEVKDGTVPKARTIYITPPNCDIIVKDKILRLRELTEEHRPKPSVDLFFSTMAEELGERAIGVIISGTGSDGSHGVKAIRAAGGMSIAQTIDTAKYDGMPNNSINTGCIDLILPPQDIIPKIISYIDAPNHLKTIKVEDEKRTVMQELMHLLKVRSGVDFKDYKEGTISRRLNRRMTACGVSDLEEYLGYVRENHSELDCFFRDIMITVTRYFRDKESFDTLNDNIQNIIYQKQETDPIRIWVPGCATGEEAYSIVILFAEAVGGINRLKQNYDFQLFATDIDVETLAIARKGVSSLSALDEIPENLKNKYFNMKEDRFEVIKPVRDMVVFSKHNVFDDPPFLRLDLISCRNLLIYFNNKLQNTVMGLFHYALNPSGLIFLGKSEALGESSKLFTSVNNKAKIFRRKLISTNEKESISRVLGTLRPRVEATSLSKKTLPNHDLPDAVIRALAPDSLLIDENMDVLRIYGDVQPYTQLSPGAVCTNLLSLARKEFRQELRALVYKVLREQRETANLIKKIKISGKLERVDISVRPLFLKRSPDSILLISFEIIQNKKGASTNETEDVSSNPLISELEQELRATREHLQTVVEELETSNDELQSTNEEMQSTNEELQSANEELETTNEELQSTNEELMTVNDELQVKSAELMVTNEDLEIIKESIDIPLLVVDKNLVITRYNEAAQMIFILGSHAAGNSLTSIGTKIDLSNLRQNVMRVIETSETFTQQIEDGDKSFIERIMPCRDGLGVIKGAILTYIDNTHEQHILHELKDTQERHDLAIRGANAGIWDWNIVTGEMHWSPLFLKMLGIYDEHFSPSLEILKKAIHEDDLSDFEAILEAHLHRGFEFNVEFRAIKDNGTIIWLNMRGEAIWNHNKKPIRMTGSVYDVTERVKSIENLQRNNQALERFAHICSHDLKEPARLIENFADLFHSNYGSVLDDMAREYLTQIQDSARRMQAMIGSILKYSKVESKTLDLSTFPLQEEVDKVLADLQLSIREKNVEIQLGSLPIIYADRIQIYQVLQNIIS